MLYKPLGESLKSASYSCKTGNQWVKLPQFPMVYFEYLTVEYFKTLLVLLYAMFLSDGHHGDDFK